MQIRDPGNLIPYHDILHRVAWAHPFCTDLWDKIREITVVLAGQHLDAGPTIEFNRMTNDVTFYVVPEMATWGNYEYILFHEFGHIADRLNPTFEYSDELRFSLSDTEQLNLMELWNLYIDARLYSEGRFELGQNDKGIYCRINGRLQKAPFSIEGKLLRHTSFLSSRGIKDARQIVQKIWDNPITITSYRDLISVVTGEDG